MKNYLNIGLSTFYESKSEEFAGNSGLSSVGSQTVVYPPRERREVIPENIDLNRIDPAILENTSTVEEAYREEHRISDDISAEKLFPGS